MKKAKIFLSAFLVLLLICTPTTQALSAEYTEQTKEEVATVTLAETPTVIDEDPSLRDQNSKHFLLSDGTSTAVAYDSVVHYQSEKTWVEIDNSLISASLLGNPLTGTIKRNTELTQEELQNLSKNRISNTVSSGDKVGYLENNENDFKVQLPKELAEDMPIRVTYKEHTLQFQCDSVSAALANITQPVSVSQSSQALQEKLEKASDTVTRAKIQNEHDMSVFKNRSSVSYQSAFQNIDLYYYIHGQSLKEDIILSSLPSQQSFSFTFTYTGMKAVLEEDNRVSFLDKQGKIIFTIAAPYMFDSDEGYSQNIAVQLEETPSGCRYTLSPDRAWLTDPKRVYPVTLDPTVYTTQNASYIHDNGVQQSDPNTVYTTADRMYVGSGSNSKIGRIYFKLTKWPSATNLTEAKIKNARLQLSFYPQASWQTAYQLDVKVYKLAASWNTNSISWNNQPSGGTYISQSTIDDAREKTTGYTEFNVTSWVKSHYANPSTDYGIRLQPSTASSTVNRACYISSDYYDNTALRPIIYITYYNFVFGLVGINDANLEKHDHTSFMNSSVPSNYSKSKNVDTSPSETLAVLRKSRAFISRSHGSKTSITCNGGNLTRSDILALPTGALSHMKLVYYGACSTGEDGASAANLVNATYARGAKTVIGFKNTVGCNSTNIWTNTFMASISAGKTIADAMRDADNQFEDDSNPVKNRLVRGATNVTVS